MHNNEPNSSYNCHRIRVPNRPAIGIFIVLEIFVYGRLCLAIWYNIVNDQKINKIEYILFKKVKKICHVHK